jgi:hypothetical protein
MKSDWSKISTDDLITIDQVFEQAVENEDGTYSIHLNAVLWSRCFAVKYEIGHERQRRDDERESG